MEGFVLEGYDYESILADVEDLTDLWLKHKLLCFREAHLTPDQLSHVMLKFGSVNNYFKLSGQDRPFVEPSPQIENRETAWTGWGAEYGQVHLETHAEAHAIARMITDHDMADARAQQLRTGVNGLTFKSSFVGWHTENPHLDFPQICSAFTMPWKSCPKDQGETGFVNYGDLYNSLPDDLKDLTRDEPAFIEYPPVSPSTRLKTYLVASKEFCAKVREGHCGDSIPIRPIALPHPITGEYSIRHHNCSATGFMNPNISDDVFHKLKQTITDFTMNEDNQFWWQWTVGDFLLVDFWMMCHSVSNFPLGERSMMGCFGWPLEKVHR